MKISEKKQHALYEEMARLEINESDLEEQFVLGSGSGGQKIQKTHSCVVLKHIPTSIEVKCQKTRSREENRFFARRLLCEKIAHLRGEKTQKDLQAEKIRKQKKRKKRRAQTKSEE